MQGIHLIRHAIYRTQDLGGQYLLLGTGHLDGDFRCAGNAAAAHNTACQQGSLALSAGVAFQPLNPLPLGFWLPLPPVPQTALPAAGCSAAFASLRRLTAMLLCRRLDSTNFRAHPDVRLLVMYSEALAHLLYAAADIVLVTCHLSIQKLWPRCSTEPRLSWPRAGAQHV